MSVAELATARAATLGAAGVLADVAGGGESVSGGVRVSATTGIGTTVGVGVGVPVKEVHLA